MTINTKVYTQQGTEKETIALPVSVFGVPFNADLVHEVVVSMQHNARANTAHTKDRSEVSGGGRKPWRQKGTGRARHGSRRSPIWTGGGVTFGPRNERDYSRKINKKVRAKALASVLSKKFTDNEILIVDNLNFAEPKTAEAKTVLKSLALGSERSDLATKRKNAALVVLGARDEMTEKSFRNFGTIAVVQAKDLNPVDLLTYKYVIVSNPSTVLEILEQRVANVTKN